MLKPIVSVYTGFFSGGARNVHTDLISQIAQADFPQVVISMADEVDRGFEGRQKMTDDSNYKRLLSEGFNIESLGLDTSDEQVDYAAVQAMAGKLLELDPSVILSLKEQPVKLLVEANKYLETIGYAPYPIIVTLHRTDPAVQDPAAINMLKEMEHTPQDKKHILGYLACAESAAVAYKRVLGLEDEALNRFDFIPNGIDLDLFQPSSDEAIQSFIDDRVPDVTKETPLVIIGARNSKEKNIDLFVASAVEFLEQRPDAHVVMCGSGMEQEKLSGLIDGKAASFDPDKQSSIKSRIHPIGRLSREEMVTLATMANIVALTSPTLGEADPLVLKEGMACGAIPISTCTGDTASVAGIDNPADHYLTPIEEPFIVGTRGIITSQNASDIAAAWQYGIDNPDEFLDNIQAYRSEMDQDKFVSSYIQAITNMCSRDVPKAEVREYEFDY